jgi:hypothetical protein
MSRNVSVANGLAASQGLLGSFLLCNGHEWGQFRFYLKLYTIPLKNCDEYESNKNNSIVILISGEVPF